jgi:AAA15 family ATPase/GTPase
MLTRLKPDWFKNLVDVEVRLGPVTCIAGANGVGKSNLFDAITFLSALADRPLIDASRSVRDDDARTIDLYSLSDWHAANPYRTLQRVWTAAAEARPQRGKG